MTAQSAQAAWTLQQLQKYVNECWTDVVLGVAVPTSADLRALEKAYTDVMTVLAKVGN